MDSGELNYDIPDTGAIFAFGKNVPNRFYVKNDKIISMDCGEGHAAMVTGSGRVFGFGQNDYGQLGVGSKTMQAKPVCVKQLKEDGVKATKVACGPTHTLVLADDGIVYGFGNNSDGQLTGDESDFTRPTEIEQLDRVEVRDLAAGRAFSLAVSKKGELLAWGGNAEGCLGQDDPDLPGSPDPLSIHLPGRVTAVSAGSYHCACVLTDGRLFAWGETERGKLGIRNAEDDEFLFSPKQVQVPGHERVQMVSCGQQHTLVLTESGKVFACGSGEAGQLGMGAACTYAPMLKLVTGLEKIKVACVSAGERHSMCVCAKTGQLYAFGDALHGKLGVKPASSNSSGRFSSSSAAAASYLFEPTLVAVLKPVSAQLVVCGTLLTAILAVPSKSKQSGTGRPGSSASDNENDDQLPALKGRSSSLGRSNSFQDNGGPASSAAPGKVGRSGLAPLAINGTGAGNGLASSNGRLDKSGRFSPIGLRGGTTSPRYGSDNDALRPMKKLDPISGKKSQDDLNASSKKSRSSAASSKFDSLIKVPSDSNSDSDDGKRLKGPVGNAKPRGSGAKSPAVAGSRTTGTSGLASRRGLAPLKLRSSDDSDEDSDSRRGKGGKSAASKKQQQPQQQQRGRLRSDSSTSPPPFSSRRSRLPSIEKGKAGGGARRYSGDDNGKAGTDDEDNFRGRRRRVGRNKSPHSAGSASPSRRDGAGDDRRRSKKDKDENDDEADDGTVKGVGCLRPRTRRVDDEDGEDGEKKKSRSCELL